MTILVLGVLLWSFAHFFKRIAPSVREPMGDRGKGIVALLLLVSVVLMVVGYRAADTTFLWSRPAWGGPVNNIMMVIAVYFVTPGPKKGALFYKMRHPMLTGFLTWSIAHVLVNGDTASLVLFGGLGLWALASMRIITNAEPDWTPNGKGAVSKDIMFLAIAIVLTGAIGAVHSLFGLTPFGA